MTVLRAVGWIASTTIGLAVAGFIFHFPGSFGEPVWQPFGMVFGGLIGAISGAGVGLAQWVGLGFPGGRLGRLVGAMALGVGVSHGLADGAPTSLGLPVVALVGAVAVTAGYAIRTSVAREPIVLGASVLGWAGGWLVGQALASTLGMPWTETPVGWAQEHALVGLAVGLVWAGSTAIVGLPSRLVGRPVGDTTLPSGSAA